MTNPTGNLETLWDRLLSRDSRKVYETFSSLSVPEKEAVKAHLHRMLTEEGWHPEQQLSAKIALQALEARDG